jgi:ADP-ribose pyrophosphatase YjhB (NUDIX family)
MLRTTLVFLLKDDKILLALKKRKFGEGKWNGVGGKLEEGESVVDCAVREVKEEIDVDVKPGDLERVGTLHFDYKDSKDWTQECAVFFARTWTGEPTESEEMKPEWYSVKNLPFENMWSDDPHWLPLVLAGKKIDARFFFEDKSGSLINFAAKEI